MKEARRKQEGVSRKVVAGSTPQVTELTADLQRMRADFENYRKNADIQKTQAYKNGQESAILKILPVIDNIERATSHIPAELADNDWARGVAVLGKNLEIIMSEFGLTKINAEPGTKFDPNLHEAVQFDESADGKTEIIETELQPGYLLNGIPIRHAMVRVAKK